MYDINSIDTVTFIFSAHLHCNNISSIYICNCHVLYLSLLANYLCQVRLCKLHVSLSGNTELKPGPKSSSCGNFPACHWNLNSISAHNFSKVAPLNAYSSLYSFDITCSWETCLDSSTSSHDPHQEVQAYDLIGADYPSNVKRCGVCI